jgi:predicted metal-dependent hydrolase
MDITVIRKRIKNLYVRVRPGGRVTVTAPVSMKEKDIRNFIQSRKEWIERSLAQMPDIPAYTYEEGEMHVLFGEKKPIVIDPDNKNYGEIKKGQIVLHLKKGETQRGRLFETMCRKALRPVIERYIAIWAPRLGVAPGKISIRNMNSRWGSCSYMTGNMSFALDLVSKPLPLIESVVVHELIHMLEPSHNKRFYAIMESCLPDYKERRHQLNRCPREFYKTK